MYLNQERVSTQSAPSPRKGCEVLHLNPSAEVWLNAGALAEVAGISERKARQAITLAANGKCWRGYRLTVRTDPADSRKRQVSSLSLPPELREKITPRATNNADAAIGLAGFRRVDKRATALAKWRFDLIEPALQHPRGSAERRNLIRDLAAVRHTDISGRQVSVSERTIDRWISRYEMRGFPGLHRKDRSDRGQTKTLITRRWDAACPLPDEARQEIAGKLRQHVRSLWASDVPGWAHVARLGSAKLKALCDESGWVAPMEVCRLTRPYVEQHRDYRIIAVHDRDAKRFHDRHLARVRRHRDGLKPMDLVVGDVHPVDIAVTRPDGSTVYPRTISWHDISTNRIHLTIIPLEPREGVRREHVAQSFAAMAEEWGLPRALYLDNGAEYNWTEMLSSFDELSRLSDQFEHHLLNGAPGVGAIVRNARQTIIRARPYNAAAKPIEGLFGVLEGGVFRMIPGWVGGDRMRKRTHNVGKAPRPFPGDYSAFQSAVGTALSYYHEVEQGGHLRGRSPNEAYRGFIEAGWARTAIKAEALMVAFAEEAVRAPDRGYISFGGTSYYHDNMLHLTGRRVRVRVAKHDPRYAFVFDGEELVCAAGVARSYHFLDPEGAHEQNRRAKLQRQIIRGKRQNVVSLDLVDQMDQFTRERPAAPQAPIGRTVELGDDARQMVRALEYLGEDEESPDRRPAHEHYCRDIEEYLSLWAADEQSDSDPGAAEPGSLFDDEDWLQ